VNDSHRETSSCSRLDLVKLGPALASLGSVPVWRNGDDPAEVVMADISGDLDYDGMRRSLARLGHARPGHPWCARQGIKLPTVENCPECNRAYNNSNSSRRVCFDDKRPTARDHHGFDNQRVSVHDQLGGKASVHDRLGGKASVHNRLGG
jgi:hypothetical protein